MHAEGCAAVAGAILVLAALCMVVGFWPVLIGLIGLTLIGFAQR